MAKPSIALSEFLEEASHGELSRVMNPRLVQRVMEMDLVNICAVFYGERNPERQRSVDELVEAGAITDITGPPEYLLIGMTTRLGAHRCDDVSGAHAAPRAPRRCPFRFCRVGAAATDLSYWSASLSMRSTRTRLCRLSVY